MKILLAAILTTTTLTVIQSQVTYPYNPDGDVNGSIAVNDLQDFLTYYGLSFNPTEITVDSIPLSDYLMMLQESVVQQSLRLDSLEMLTLNVSIPLDVAEYTFCWSGAFYYEDRRNQFLSCCDEKLDEGWTPQGGISVTNQQLSQAFVKHQGN
jgi:hypothetical protein